MDKSDKEKLLDTLIEKGLCFSDLEKHGLEFEDCCQYLFMNDRISLAEIANFFKINKSTAYRRYYKKATKNQKINNLLYNDDNSRKSQKILLNPLTIFEKLNEPLEQYKIFIQWRRLDSDRKTRNNITKSMISINHAAKLLNITTRQMYKIIDRENIDNIKGYLSLISFEKYLKKRRDQIKVEEERISSLIWAVKEKRKNAMKSAN